MAAKNLHLSFIIFSYLFIINLLNSGTPAALCGIKWASDSKTKISIISWEQPKNSLVLPRGDTQKTNSRHEVMTETFISLNLYDKVVSIRKIKV